MLEKNSDVITEAEAALYDRQIRLWGLDAQKRLRASRVLLIGLGGLGAEVAKNIILSGVKSVTLLDHQNVSVDDRCSQFLVDHDNIGKNRAECSLERAQQLNPMVRVMACSEHIDAQPDEYLSQYDIVCATQCTRSTLLRLNNYCRQHDKLFYAGDVWGFYGYMFADLKDHEYAEDVPVTSKSSEGANEPEAKKQKTVETTTVKKFCSFVSLAEALHTDWSTPEKLKALKRTPNTYFITQIMLEYLETSKRSPSTQTATEDRIALAKLRPTVLDKLKVTHSVVPEDFVNTCVAQLSPVCAVVGGVLGQEIIKAVSKKDAPHNNFFFYNGVEGSGMVDCIKQ